MHAFRAPVRRCAIWTFLAACVWPATALAQVSFGSGQLIFDPTFIGKTSAQATTLTNSSSTTVFVMANGISNSDYALQGSDCPFSSAASLLPFGPGASCTVFFQFMPSITGSDDGSFAVQIVDALFQPLGSAALALGGTGRFPLTFSPTALDFGYVRENLTSAPGQSLTITNSGGVLVSFAAAIANADYSVDSTQCPLGFFAPDASCVVNVSFNPTITGADPASLVVSAFVLGNGRDLGRVAVPVTGAGHPLGVSSFVDFGVDLLGGTYQQTVSVFNASDSPVRISSAAVAGASFSNDDGCIGTLAARAFCAIIATFSPTTAGPANGTLTLVDDDPTSPQVIPITAAATALVITAQYWYPGSGTFAFFDQPLGTTSPVQQVSLTNVSTKPVPLTTTLVNANRTDFAAATTCKKSQVPAGGSCVVAITFTPTADGTGRGTVTISPSDPIGTVSVTLLGDGIGIRNRQVRLHYDYMVAADHTHDPEVVSPGAIQRVIDAFAQHGVSLVVDPHHVAIPEVATVSFSEDPAPRIVCPNSQANFLDLRDRYFTRKFPDQHYTIFSHFLDADEPFRCTGGATGESDLPGLDFVVSLGTLMGFSADYVSFATSGTLMHELGHNLGLHHGGGVGILEADDTNYKPNYLSIMNYNHDLTGIVQASAIGSSTVSRCVRDADCAPEQSCISGGSSASGEGSCRRLDYSTQLLPTGGNTPGSLDERDLDETAGLGSWTADIGLFSTCEPGGGPVFGVIGTNGPVDWDDDGAATDQHLATQVDFRTWGTQVDCNQPLRTLAGFDDWAHLLGTARETTDTDSRLTSTTGAPINHADESGLDVLEHPERHHPSELDVETARRQHVLVAPRQAALVVMGGCQRTQALVGDSNGLIDVALLAAAGFDVGQVDFASLRFRRARPVNTWLADVNADGVPDLVVSFRASDLAGARGASARLSGWFTDGQALLADGDVPLCRP